MGFGLDAVAHKNRLWKFPVLFTIDDGFSIATRNGLIFAMDKWKQAGDGTPLFRPVATAGAGTVRVSLTGGSNAWSSGDAGMVGRHPQPVLGAPRHNTLFLKDGSSMATLVHEVGHCLGLAHEHDRPDATATKYRKTLTLAFADQVADNATKVKKYVSYGAFDGDSIMCYGVTVDAPSAGDLATVKAMYGW